MCLSLMIRNMYLYQLVPCFNHCMLGGCGAMKHSSEFSPGKFGFIREVLFRVQIHWQKNVDYSWQLRWSQTALSLKQGAPTFKMHVQEECLPISSGCHARKQWQVFGPLGGSWCQDPSHITHTPWSCCQIRKQVDVERHKECTNRDNFRILAMNYRQEKAGKDSFFFYILSPHCYHFLKEENF